MRRLNIPWPQVADFRGYSSELAIRFGVESLPANFLVAGDGELVASNLRGEALQREIVRLFNNSPVD